MATCTIVNNPFIESCCLVSVEVTGEASKTMTFTLENGDVITSAFTDNNTTYTLAYASGNLTFTPSVGSATVIPLSSMISGNSGNTITIGSDGGLFADDVTTTVTNNTDGHRIATYINEDNVSFDIDETITQITGATLGADNVLTINYRNETGVSASTTVNLSTLAADVKVLSLQYNAATNTITITNTDGTTNSVVLTDIIDVITNTLTMTGNTLESTVNGVSDSVDVITSASLSKVGTDLVMSVNGVQASIPISSIADGSETKVTAGTNVSIAGTGSSGNPYIISSIDTNTTYTASISGNVITLTGSDGSTQTINLPAASVPDGSETKVNAGTGVAISGTGTIADPYIVTNTVVDTNTTYTSTISGNVITLTGSDGSVQTINLPTASVPDGSETKVTAGTGVSVSGAGTIASPYVVTSTVVDTNTTYSYAITGNNLVITDSAGASTTLAIPCTCTGNETKITAGSNVTLTGTGTTADPYVLNSSAATIVTGVTVTGTDTKTITISLSDGTSVTGTFTDLQGSGGPSADAGNILYAGTDGGPLLKITDLISSDAGNKAVVGTDGKVYVPAPDCCPVTLEIFQGDEFGSDVVTLTLANGTELTANTGPLLSEDNPGMNNLSIGTDGGLYFDLSAQADYITLANKVVTAVAVTGTTNKTLTLTFADGTTLTTPFTDLDTDTKYAFSISGNVITATGTDGTTQNITLPSGTVPDGSETKVNAGSNVTITGTGTTADPYVINSSSSATADGSETKINVGTGLNITGTGTTANPYVLSNTVVDTDTNTTYALSISGTNVTLTGSDGSTSTIALPTGTADTNTTYTLAVSGTNLVFTGSDGAVTNLAIPCACDGSETKVEAGSSMDVTGVGTVADPYILNVVAATEAIAGAVELATTAEASTGTAINLAVTPAGVTSAINSAFTSCSGAAITKGTSLLVCPASPGTDGQVLTKQPDGSYAWETPSAGSVADGSETKITVGAGLTVTGTGTTANPYVLVNTIVDTDTNTTYNLSIAGTNVTLNGSDGSTSTIALPTGTADTNTTYTLAVSGTNLVFTGSDGVVTTVAVPCACTGNETKVTAGTNTTVTGTGTTADPYVINATSTPAADGSETKINAGTGISLSGSGTTASPYVITNLVTDTNTTYTTSISGNILTLTGSDGSVQNITLPSADGSETKVTAGTNVTVTGSGTTASPYVINSTDTNTKVTAVAITGTDTKTVTLTLSDGSTVSGTFTDKDTDTTYTMSLSGSTLTLTPSSGTAQTVTLPTADGSETKLTAGTGVSITGTGTTASPYTITNTVTDTNTTYSVAVSGNTLTLTPSSGTAQNVTLPTADGSETKVTAGTGVTVTGTGTTASPYVINSSGSTADGSETKVQTTDPLLSVTGSGTTASPYSVSYVGPRVLYKYCAYITGNGGSGGAPAVQEIYDNIPGGVGAWSYGGCNGFYTNNNLTYSFNRANTVVQVTPVTAWAGLATAGQGLFNTMTLGVTNGSTYVPGSIGCDFGNGTNSFVVYYEVTVYDTNPNP